MPEQQLKLIHQAANALECDGDSGEIASRVVPAMGCAGLTHDRDAGFRGDIVRTPADPVCGRSRDRTVPCPAQDAAGNQMYVTLSEIHDLPLPVSLPITPIRTLFPDANIWATHGPPLRRQARNTQPHLFALRVPVRTRAQAPDNPIHVAATEVHLTLFEHELQYVELLIFG